MASVVKLEVGNGVPLRPIWSFNCYSCRYNRCGIWIISLAVCNNYASRNAAWQPMQSSLILVHDMNWCQQSGLMFVDL